MGKLKFRTLKLITSKWIMIRDITFDIVILIGHHPK